MVFPVVMYRCESWTIKKAECWRIDAFELWCWRRLWRVPWTERRSNQSILKAISPEYSLEGLMVKLKLQFFGQLMQRTDSLEKILMLGKTEARERDNRGWDSWMESPTGWQSGSLACCSPWSREESDTTNWLNWTEHSQSLLHSQWSRSIFFFLEFPSFLYDPMNVGNFIFGSSASLKPSLCLWNFQFTYWWSLAWRI